MNNKMFIKIGWMFIFGLLAYLFFIVFYLSPKINDYLSNKELQTTRIQFSKIVTTINNKSIKHKDNTISIDEITKEIKLLLSSINLGKSGFIYILLVMES